MGVGPSPLGRGFLGRPTGSGRSRRFSLCSSLLKNESLARGRPQWVHLRSLAESSGSSGSRRTSRHFSGSHSLDQAVRSSWPLGSGSPMWAGALDHGYRHGTRTIFARTGFRSTYRNARHRCKSSSVARVEAILPQMPAPAVCTVDVLGIPEMSPADSLGERLFARGHSDEVKVVGHQAIAEDLQAESLRFLSEHCQIHAAVIVSEEDVLSVVAALDHMVRHLRHHDSGNTRHELDPTDSGRPCQ